MPYAGFWLRLIAMFIDGIVFLPVAIIYLYTRAASWEMAVMTTIPYCFLYAFYNVYFHARWGRTIGKMIIRIKVVTINGKDIRYGQAFMRHSVDMVLAFLSAVAFTMALGSVKNTGYFHGDWQQLNTLFHNALPGWWNSVKAATQAWVFSELVVLLTNKEKRSVHDFIAGTVVVRTDMQKGFQNKQWKDNVRRRIFFLK